MNLKQLTLFCVASGLSIAGFANTYTVYKTTNANGVPTFSQIPPSSTQNYDVLTFRNDGRVTTAADEPRQSDNTGNNQQSQMAELEQRVNELQARENDQRCQALRNSLANMNMGGRIYEMDNNGNRVYLDDQQIQERRQRAQQAIAQFCQ